jgi:RNA polymerase sigma factor (TIGR02999 family)
MGRPPEASVTELLRAASTGDAAAFDAVYTKVYKELRRLAHVIRVGRAGETLNTTGLVHEAYLKLVPSRDLAWEDRHQFFRVAGRAMRQVLVTAAERRLAGKRGGDGPAAVTFDDGAHAEAVRAEELIALDDALERLGVLEPRQARVVELRYFTGLTAEEVAEVLGTSTPTVQRDWRAARAWLSREMADTHDSIQPRPLDPRVDDG